MIDLQVHTTESDGKTKLVDVVKKALDNNLSAIAITDHDTIEAYRTPRLRELYRDLGKNEIVRKGLDDRFFIDDLVVIQGAEITCRYEEREVHLLAFGLTEEKVDNKLLGVHMRRMEHAHKDRMRTMVEKLKNKKYKISYEELENAATSPHMLTRAFVAENLLNNNKKRLTRELAKIGKQATILEVRNNTLGKESEFYMPITDFYRLPKENTIVPFPTMKDAVKMILDCDAWPVLSHPSRYKFLDYGIQKKYIRRKHYETERIPFVAEGKISPMKIFMDLLDSSNGLAGIEIFNGRHPEHAEFWLGLSKLYNMHYTVGTDFHGDGELGVHSDSPDLSDEIVMRNVHQAICKVRKARNL